tara:strand:+ start:606 stop:1619 length:1014 start_codon:yes stop_codon:yes gene_type:complete
MKTNNPFGALGQLPNNFGSSLALIANGLGMMGGAPSNTGLINAGRAMDRDAQERAGQQRFSQLMRDPNVVGLLPKNIQAILPFMAPQAAGNIVAQYQARTARDAREAAAAEESRRRFNQSYGLQRDKLDLQKQIANRPGANQYERRAEAAQKFGLTPGTKEFQDYVLGRKTQTSQQNTYKDLNQLNSSESSLRKEFTKDTQDFEKIQQFKKQITNAPNTGAGALSAVFGFMKLLDPNSVVRPGEKASAENAGGVPARLRSIWNRALRGGMGEELMAEFRAEAERIYGDRLKRYNRRYKRYEGIAKRRGMDPRNVLPPRQEEPEPGAVNNNDPAGIRE